MRHEGEDTRGDDGADTHAGEREPPELLLEGDVTIHFGVVSDLCGQSGEPGGGACGQSESETKVITQLSTTTVLDCSRVRRVLGTK